MTQRRALVREKYSFVISVELEGNGVAEGSAYRTIGVSRTVHGSYGVMSRVK